MLWRATELRDAANANCGSAEAFDAGAEGDQDLAKVHDFGFAGGGADDGFAAGENGGHHDVGGASDRRAAGAAKIHFSAVQRVGFGDDVTVFDTDVRSEGREAAKVQVDSALADVAAAGKRDDGTAAAREEWTEDAKAGTHLVDEGCVGCDGS